MAFSRSATASTWLVGTNRNVGSLSMNRLISQGQAMRSTRAFSRVTHFMGRLLLQAAGFTGDVTYATLAQEALQATMEPWQNGGEVDRRAGVSRAPGRREAKWGR